MKCKHKNSRKLFWMDSVKNKWMRTDFSFCLECKKIVKLEEVKK